MTIGLSFVAFVDILGFGDMVVADCETATPGEVFLPKLKSAIHTALAQAETVDARITQFSDSIVVAAPFLPNIESLINFLKLILDLQAILFMSGVLCRGGISHGRHFHDETILFSQGLIEAYKIENSVAVDPRIVISKETIELIAPGEILASEILVDIDGEFFLDFMGSISSLQVSVALDGLRPALFRSNPRVRSKISWLFRYAHHKFPDIALPPEITIHQMN